MVRSILAVVMLVIGLTLSGCGEGGGGLAASVAGPAPETGQASVGTGATVQLQLGGDEWHPAIGPGCG